MVWWFVIAAVVLLVVVALWRLNTRVKRREGYTSERQARKPLGRGWEQRELRGLELRVDRYWPLPKVPPPWIFP